MSSLGGKLVLCPPLVENWKCMVISKAVCKHFIHHPVKPSKVKYCRGFVSSFLEFPVTKPTYPNTERL